MTLWRLGRSGRRELARRNKGGGELFNVKRAQLQGQRELQKRREQEQELRRRTPGGFFALLPDEVLALIVDEFGGEGKALLNLASTCQNLRRTLLPRALERVNISCGWDTLCLEASDLLVQHLCHWNLLRPLLALYKYPDTSPYPASLPPLPALLSLIIGKQEDLLSGEPELLSLPALFLIAPKVAQRAPKLWRLYARAHHLSGFDVPCAFIPLDAWTKPTVARGGITSIGQHLSCLTLSINLSKQLLKDGVLALCFRAMSQLPSLDHLRLDFNELSIDSEVEERCWFGDHARSLPECPARSLVKSLENLRHLRELIIGHDPVLYSCDQDSCLLGHLARSPIFGGLRGLDVPFHFCFVRRLESDLVPSLKSRLQHLRLRSHCPCVDPGPLGEGKAKFARSLRWRRRVFNRLATLQVLVCQEHRFEEESPADVYVFTRAEDLRLDELELSETTV